MAPWKHCTIHKNLSEEIDRTNDADRLKQITQNLIKDNFILTRRTNTVLKSLENQNILIKYMQETLKTMMAQNMLQSLEFIEMMGRQMLMALNRLCKNQRYLYNLIEEGGYNEDQKKMLDELYDATWHVPYGCVRLARAKCVQFVYNLVNEVRPEGSESEGAVTSGVRNLTQNGRIINPFVRNLTQNGRRINPFRRQRNQHYRIKAKRNVCKHSRKPKFNKSQNNKSESNVKKNSRYPKSANPGKTSQSHDIQPTNFPKQEGLKAEELNDTSGSKSDVGSSASINNIPAEPSKMMKSELKSVVIKLKDFMKDPSADNDKYIVQYKQANCDKINEEELQVVDDTDDDLDEVQRVDSSHNSDNDGDVQEDEILVLTIESSDDQLEPEEYLTPEPEEYLTPSRSPSTSRSSCTPSRSQSTSRSSCTPSRSSTSRSSCTPPGLESTTDSEGMTDHDDKTRRLESLDSGLDNDTNDDEEVDSDQF